MLPVISGLIGLGQQWLEGRQQVSKAKAESKAASIRADESLRQKAMDNEGAWEALQAQASAKSWKDEGWTIFFICVLALGFWPGGQAVLDQWLAYVSKLPDWMSTGILISIAASFGIRGIASATLGRRKK